MSFLAIETKLFKINDLVQGIFSKWLRRGLER